MPHGTLRLSAAALLLSAGSAFATPKTPSHVYQAVGGVEHEVRALLEADFVDVDDVREATAEQRLPRHVFAKLVEVGEKVALKRRLHGLDDDVKLRMPAKIIAPGDVFEGVAALRAAVDDLVDLYGLAHAPSDEAAPSGKMPGKTPGDVYARLSALGVLFDRGFQPATVPNDVFRVAAAVKAETVLLAKALGVEGEAPAVRASGKKPAQVHRLAIDFSGALAKLAAARADIAPTGGVFAPAAIEGAVTPAQVRDALNVVLADLMEIRLKAGVDAPLQLAAPPVGKTPSDVFAELHSALLLIDSVVAASH